MPILGPRMPDLAALAVLTAVARSGSLGAAARELGTTQQAVSTRIAALEVLVGVPLVVRSPRGSTLTPAGATATQWADRLLQVADEVDAGLAALREQGRSRLRVSASMTVAEQLLPGWMLSFRDGARRPGLTGPEIVLTATNSERVLADVVDGASDLGFVEGPSVPRGLRSRVVATDELVVVVAPQHRWARRARVVSPTDLAAEPLVSREPGSGTRESLSVALRRAGVTDHPATPVLQLSSAAAVRSAVVAGAGPAAVSRLAVGADLAARRLVEVRVRGLELTRALRAVWRGGPAPPAGVARGLVAHVVGLHAGAPARAAR